MNTEPSTNDERTRTCQTGSGDAETITGTPKTADGTSEGQVSGDAACCALVSILQKVGVKLKEGFDTRGIPCKVKPFTYGFEIQMSGVSLCVGGRGTVEEPNLCVSSCECDLVGNITGPIINTLKMETPVASGQYSPEPSVPRTLGELRRSLRSFHEVSSGGRLSTLAGLNIERPEPS